MKFGYTIVYVPSVADTLTFYKEAFGLETRFLHESGQYGELNTGETVLAFASHAMGEMNLDGHYQKSDLNAPPFGVELAFLCQCGCRWCGFRQGADCKALGSGGCIRSGDRRLVNRTLLPDRRLTISLS
jgi:hypothetical protein